MRLDRSSKIHFLAGVCLPELKLDNLFIHVYVKVNFFENWKGKMNKRIVISGSCRTPVGRFAGRLKSVKAQELLRTCFKGSLEKAGIQIENIDSVVASTCVHSPNAMNVARVAILLAGLPDDAVDTYNKGEYLKEEVVEKSRARNITAFTPSFNCGSGVQAVISAVHEIVAGDSRVVLVGGTESMSNSPMLLERGSGSKMRDSLLEDSLVHGLRDPLTGELMGRIAENTVEKYGVSREEQDLFAVESHTRAYEAISSGKFETEIVPVKSIEKGMLGDIRESEIYEDEGPNPTLTVSKLATLKSYFKKDGTITPANSCTVNDGAASFLVMELERALELGVTLEAEILGYGKAAGDPSHMGEGPIWAIPKALKMAGLTEGQIDFFEINEAFAGVVLATKKHFQIPGDRLNIRGGAVALGHPVGTSGAKLLTTLIHILHDFKKDYGLVSLCVGNGQGIALVIKRFV
ncbi:MAG: thiolase family protein [Candidatus Yanofskybacteria bacterium]|nr:thiolase family protein [Candidatus Yanofskybacteria bacterium]